MMQQGRPSCFCGIGHSVQKQTAWLAAKGDSTSSTDRYLQFFMQQLNQHPNSEQSRSLFSHFHCCPGSTVQLQQPVCRLVLFIGSGKCVVPPNVVTTVASDEWWISAPTRQY